MNTRFIDLPDGRYLIFYTFAEGDSASEVNGNPNPMGRPRVGEDRTSELRWNPLSGEWVGTATHRQNRTYFPPPGFCPFCPAQSMESEVPESTYDIAVLENKFPSFQAKPGSPSVESTALMPVRTSQGICEVVLYSPDHQLSLAQMSVEHIHNLVLVWSSRYLELSKLPFVKYVFIFENKGEAIGVTLHHPHGQIYGYPFIPPKIQIELENSRAYQSRTGSCLICDILRQEERENQRIITENPSFVAVVPFFARWPYEVHVVSKRHLQAITDLEPAEQRDLASILKAVLSAYDRLFEISFPYIMAMHQKPNDGDAYDYYHFHIEFYPPMRSASRLKFLAGSETGAGVFINDSLPEITAAELRSHVLPVVWESPEIPEMQ